MSRFASFLALSATHRMLFLRAVILLAAIRLALPALPFARLRDALAHLAAHGATKNGSVNPVGDAALAIWAVETAGRHFPTIGTCLTQALAAYVLLGRTGHKSDLRIGVRRHAEGFLSRTHGSSRTGWFSSGAVAITATLRCPS